MSEQGNDAFEEAFAKLLESDTEGLLDAPEKPQPITSADRLERAFMEIAEFYRDHGRVPSSTTHDVSERKLGARLDGFRANEAKAEAVADLDDFGLLAPPAAPENLDDLLEADELDLLDNNEDIFDVSSLPEVKRNLDDVEIAVREKAKDFEKFEHLFKAKHAELAAGDAVILPFKGVSTIKPGRFFILGGLMLFIAEIGEVEYKHVGGRERPKERLRVIFENGTESAMYKTSLSIRMGEQNGRAIAPANHTIDMTELGDADVETGHIYILKSLSQDPTIKGIPHLHKIGFCTTTVEQRIANAQHDPTYLMAPVEIVADYRVYNVRPSRLENLIHRVFADVRLDMTQINTDRESYNPSEWFIVPAQVIDQAVQMIISGDITDFIYDEVTQSFKWTGNQTASE
ncbi:GIY-YIG nuclease family protein [Schaalia sp. lx-100]|uniref:GIY-YIG nuclease family protein n=1 Tax=Schaalia sp. lx-100 TaxID=2899081 RepID=UPI001E3DFAC8|nr:GIY-YIG nuclease family protein [Schaalia sp. lx-100]MCD4557719.1 GIY-YIG nuclease family protein [Schaalia sp. lx-100]